MKAREYLQDLGVNVVEYNIGRNKEKKKEMIMKSGSSGVPFIDIEGIYITGFSKQRILKAVEDKRSM